MTSGSAVRPHIASEAKPHVNVLVDVSVNVPDLAIFCPADRYLVVCWITKNWMFTGLL